MSITAEQINQAIGDASVTFARIEFTTDVAVAAKHKGENLKKHTVANVMLFSNIRDYAGVYKRKVQKSAANYNDNDQTAVENFVVSSNYYEHTDCFSITQHKKDPTRQYLYAIFNRASSTYTHNGVTVKKEDVAEFMTPGNRRKLLNPDASVVNKTNNVEHNVNVRNISLESLTKLKIRKQLITA